MATERIQIVVTSKGVVTVRKDIESVGDASKRSASGVDMLRSALGGLTAYLGASQLLKYADTFTNIQNRLKIVTKGTEELTTATDRLYSIAQSTYTSFDGVATIYARTAQATKALGLSADQAMNFTEQLSKSTALSGVSAESARAALVQLSQGLASGTLRGEELNSMLEQLPYAANVLAAGLGKPIGELRKMGEQGQLTPKMIIEAFAKMNSAINADFANMTPTISMGLQTIENGLVRLMGLLESNTGAFGMLGSALSFVGNNLEYFAIALAPVLLGLGVLAIRSVFAAGAAGLGALFSSLTYIVPVLTTARNAILLLNAALLANPVVLIIAGLAALGVALGAVAVHVMELMGVWDDFRAFAIDCINAVLKYVNKFLTFVTGSKWSLQIIDQGASAAITKAGKDAGAHMQDGVKTGGTSAAVSLKNGVTAGGNNAGRTIDTSMTTGSIKIKDSIDKGALSFTDALWQTFKDIGAWFASLFDEWFTSGAEKIKAANAGAGAGLSDQLKKGASGAGDTLRKSVEEGGSSAAKQLNDSGSNNAKKIAQAGDAAGQRMASGVSTGGNSAGSSIRSSLERGGDYAAQRIERAAKLVGDQLAETLTGIKGAQFLPGGGMTAPIGGYANGGQFRVGGSGGTDSQRVQFNATPNERVTVETPAQQRATDAAKAGASSGGDTTLNVKAVTVFDPAAMIDALNTRAGQQAFIQFAKVNRDELQQILGVV